MFCIPYEKLTDFIADKCTFIGKGIEFLSIHTGGSTWRRYHLENQKVTKAQFFVENIPDFQCYIDDITNVRGTNRTTIKLGRPKVVEGRLEEIATVKDFCSIIQPRCIAISVDNGVTKRWPADPTDKSVIDHVTIGNHEVILYTKF